jgi:hypothetical protein
VYTRCVASVDLVDRLAALFHCPTREGGNIYASPASSSFPGGSHSEEDVMGFGRGALLWLLGVPLPIILLLALFWHH